MRESGRIDSELMCRAIADTSKVAGQKDVYFIHRTTGEIVEVIEDTDAHVRAGLLDEDMVAVATASRERVKASPDDWVKIPKHQHVVRSKHGGCRDYQAEQRERELFIEEFLSENGIKLP